MSEFHVRVVEIGDLHKHDNADTLSITNVDAYPVVVRSAEFHPGQKAVYIPADAMVPTDRPEFAFLGKDGKETARIKAMRLRGVFSMGLLIPVADSSWAIGENVADYYGITKYEPPLPLTMGGEDERDPGFIPIYTDIEGLRRYPDVLHPGEPVVLTEKIHGANGRFCWWEDRFWVGSHTKIKRESESNIWWRVARQYGLAEKLQHIPGVVLYGEVFGKVQDLKYGARGDELFFAAFDAFDIKDGRYLSAPQFFDMMEYLAIDIVPVIYRGPWFAGRCLPFQNGKTLLGADHVREGFVVRPLNGERWDESIGRVILKMPGEDYLTRKGGG